MTAQLEALTTMILAMAQLSEIVNIQSFKSDTGLASLQTKMHGSLVAAMWIPTSLR